MCITEKGKKYMSLMEELKSKILSGEIRPGEKLPSENELEENEEGSKNEIHTHRRHTFGGSPVHWKLPKGKAGKGDMDQS